MALSKPPQPQGYELYGPDPKFPDVPRDEWRLRINRAQNQMREHGIDLLMLWSRQNCRYFAGFRSVDWHVPNNQPMVTLIPVDRDPVVVTSDLLRWTVEAQSWIRDIWCREVPQGVSLFESLPKDIADAVRELGCETGNIALEKGSMGMMFIPRPVDEIQAFMEELPQANFVDGDSVVWGCRMIKSQLEIDRMTKSAAIHKQALTAMVDEYRPGMTENDVGKIFLLSAYENGADWVLPGSIMCGAEKEGVFNTFYDFEGATIKRGDYFWVDMQVSYKGYWADMGRMINVGPPSDDFKRYYEAMWNAWDAGAEVAGPGVKANDVWAAVDKIIGEAGLMKVGSLGHGVGLDIHEPPEIDATDETILQPGMTLELEALGVTGLRKFGGEGGFQYENLIVITETGCTRVMGLPRDIIHTR